MRDYRIVFAGTPPFALAALEQLVASGRRPIGVLTQPDRRAGRGRKLVHSPVKRFAIEHDLTLLQPSSLRSDETYRDLVTLRPDVLIVAAYGLLLPPSVLDLPVHGCLNIHASLLPRWRGAAPIQAAILAGDRNSGISLMQMDAGLDTGPVYARSETPIGERTTAGELHDTLAEIGGKLLCDRLDAILSGELAAEAQDDAAATYAGKVGTEDARIDWRRSAVELDRHIRAYNPVPGARFRFGDEWVKCWQARPLSRGNPSPGGVVQVDSDGIIVACGEGSLQLERLQRPGRSVVTAREFAAQLPVSDARFE